jgi:hypothetical protein
VPIKGNPVVDLSAAVDTKNYGAEVLRYNGNVRWTPPPLPGKPAGPGFGLPPPGFVPVSFQTTTTSRAEQLVE